jgi:hypothetical protein
VTDIGIVRSERKSMRSDRLNAALAYFQ